MRTKQALLFDLDNTLMDRDYTFRSFSTRFVKDYLGHLPEEEAKRVVEDMIVRDADGYRDKDGFFAELSEALPWRTPVSASDIRAYYDTNYSSHGATMKDAVEILDYCRERGYILGLVTNGKKDLQDGKIDLLGLRGYFKAIVISGEAGISKPDQAIYKLALERMGTSAEQTLFIGDHPVNDIWGAGKAGMDTVWLKRNHPWDDRLDVQPWRTINELAELKEII
ncbi:MULTISPECIES: HAD family hydrolase [unclassified Paenibacillus]|uniref:HAD family hydrolase n=1 Tax=unclassified Paenibacillus TaxID=185978 RepID=UPI0024075B93|nr:MULTISPECIES: HAD family hydrolase [unclassified Paenibacillus]MDF9841023.1 putative hydrolase of the HAD superfamily [Paenibacillus sp. PastF-2]MDF9847804.1 putative hydrolase of the HAD superfamily [Paenibacillus sp. PastM-2]MDF9854373.1 putative hydrolase of the HAD superfamily [Paenibacillus sp. PastF-1]MDH6479456.1 putative hydrolase of the HAD superfamily [Paenibacillus sp. PastH-2]MDH6505122.1 putative hydrolase of the HAD superfamily [Paenibacillus sp. PastM-3]